MREHVRQHMTGSLSVTWLARARRGHSKACRLGVKPDCGREKALALCAACAYTNVPKERVASRMKHNCAWILCMFFVASTAAAADDDGNWTMPAKNYASTRFSALDQIKPDNVAKLQVAFTFRWASRAGRRRRRSSPTTRCTSSRLSEHALRAGSDQARRAGQVEVRAASGSGVARCRLLRSSSTAARAMGRPDLLQHARRQHRRRRCERRQGAVETKARRHQLRRDHDDGAAGRARQGAGRQLRRRDGRARLAGRARRSTGKQAWRAYQHRPRRGRADRRRTSNRSTPWTRASDLGVTTWPPDAWKIGGGTAGDGFRYDPRAQPDLLRHRQSRSVECRSSAPATTSGPLACSRAMPNRAGALVLSVRARTICSTTTTSTRTCCSI